MGGGELNSEGPMGRKEKNKPCVCSMSTKEHRHSNESGLSPLHLFFQAFPQAVIRNTFPGSFPIFTGTKFS